MVKAKKKRKRIAISITVNFKQIKIYKYIT